MPGAVEVPARDECNLDYRVEKERDDEYYFELETSSSNDSYWWHICKLPYEKRSIKILDHLCSRWGEFTLWSKLMQAAAVDVVRCWPDALFRNKHTFYQLQLPEVLIVELSGFLCRNHICQRKLPFPLLFRGVILHPWLDSMRVQGPSFLIKSIYFFRSTPDLELLSCRLRPLFLTYVKSLHWFTL